MVFSVVVWWCFWCGVVVVFSVVVFLCFCGVFVVVWSFFVVVFLGCCGGVFGGFKDRHQRLPKVPLK